MHFIDGNAMEEEQKMIGPPNGIIFGSTEPTASEQLFTTHLPVGFPFGQPIIGNGFGHGPQESVEQMPVENGGTSLFGQQQQFFGNELNLPICKGCGLEIRESHLLILTCPQLIAEENHCQPESNVDPELWHENCLRCAKCACLLGTNGNGSSCFVRDGHVYCREDHAKLFGPSSTTIGNRPPQCTRCALPIAPNEFVFRSSGHVYHMHCFQCACCGQPFAKGDQYLNIEGQLICQRDYSLWQLQQQLAAGSKFGGPAPSVLENENPAHFLPLPPFPELDFSLQRPTFHHHHHSDRSKKVPKRPRTILNAPQRKAFKLAFEKGPKPSRKVREQLARETGLSVRVVQVWFQNQRAKMKKERKREMDKQQQLGNTCGGTACPNGEPLSIGATDSDGGGREEGLLLKSSGSGSTGGKSEMLADDSDEDPDEVDEDEDAVSCNSMGLAAPNLGMGAGGMDGNNVSQQAQQQNPIEKLYNMHQNYFAFV